jgi:pilus assembly protein FimV
MRKSFSSLAVKAFLSAFALCVLTLTSAHAAGLGKLTVLSALGQPLRAEIELTSVTREEVGNIVVKLASYDDYRKANLEFTSALHSLRFTVEQKGQRHFVRVSSTQALNEPFLGMLLELRSTSGRLTREYTFLLDPAELRRSAPVVATAPVRPRPVATPTPAPAPEVAAPKPVLVAPVAEKPVMSTRSPEEIKARAQALKAKTETADKPVAKSKPEAVADAKPKAEKAVQYKTKRGDALAVIAKRHKHEEVSLEQMLVSIYQTNPDAFIGKNMNRMREGRVLTMPDVETAGSVSTADARKVIVAQAADFSAYRNKLAEQAAQTAPKESADAAQAAGGKITAKVEEKATAAKDSQDKLKLSKAGVKPAAVDKASAGSGSAEDKAAQEKAAADERARVKELEKNVSDLQNVLNLKNKQLAEQQKQAELQKQADLQKQQADQAAAAKKLADEQAAAAKKLADEQLAAAAAAKAAASTPAASVPAASAPAASVPAASVPPVASAPKASVSAKTTVKKYVPPPPPPPPSFFDEMLDNPMMLGGIGIVLLLILYLVVRSRAKKKQQSALGGSLVTENRDSPNSLFGSSGGQSVDTNNSIFNSGFTPSASLLDANEVDPIAEADVYIAYGREAQAVEILKEALRSHPERNALRVKLLEIYASQKDVNAFDLLAGELYGLTRGEGEEWVYVAGLGMSIDPNNPLYAGGDVSEEMLDRPTSLQGSMTQPSPDQDPEVRLEAPRLADVEAVSLDSRPTREQIEAPDFPLDLGIAAPLIGDDKASMDFNAPMDFDAPQQEAAKPEHGPLDFDLNLPSVKEEEKPAPAALDFDLGDFGVKKEAVPEETAGVMVSEVSAAEFDRMTEFKSQASDAVSAAEDMKAQLEAADRELEAIDKVEPYSAVPQAVPQTEAPKPAASAPVEFDFGAINLDLEPAAVQKTVQQAATRASSVEMDTKIELAAAYLGIGDKEGARELLDEVIQEGSPEQIEKAKEALAKIS